MDPIAMFRKKFETFRKITNESGEKKAWEMLFAGYPERQREHMGAFIKDCSLYEGFSKAIPIYRQIGMDMQVVNISNKGTDAVLEVQRICPVMDLCKEYGFEKPCHIICEMDVEATKAAFADQGMTGGIVATQVDGNCVCIFKYERPSKE